MASFGPLRLMKEYLAWRLRSKGRHGVHSPFVYALLDNVIYKSTHDPRLRNIEEIRRCMLRSSRSITPEELGAGSALNASKTLKEIVSAASKPKKYARLLYRLSAHFKPGLILELGTSAGISAMYLAAGQKESDGRTITIEGSGTMHEIAKQNFLQAGATNIEALHGNFDQVLPQVLKNEAPAMVFFDGNHRKAPTLHYFELCLEKAENDTVFIFDDINWSEEMQQAWQEIKSHPRVTVTMDLFFIGIVFFRKEQAKEDFVIRF